MEPSFTTPPTRGLTFAIGLVSDSPYPSTSAPPVRLMNFFLTAGGRADPPETHALTVWRLNPSAFGLLLMAMYIAGAPMKTVTFCF